MCEEKKSARSYQTFKKRILSLFQIYGRAALTGDPESFETYLESLGTWLSIVVYSPKKEYFIAVFDNITERKLREDRIKWTALVNESLADLYKPLTSAPSVKEITDIILAKAQRLTGSKHGYIGTISPPNGDFIIYTLADALDGICRISDWNKHITFPKGKDGQYRGLWGHSLNTGEPFFTNSPATHPSSSGLPEGRIHLERFMSVPVMLGKEIVGQIALANSDRDYTNQDIEAVKRIAEYYVLAVQRKQADQAISDLARFPSENPNPVLRISSDGKIIYGNIASKLLQDVWNGNCVVSDLSQWKQAFNKVLMTGKGYSIEITCFDRAFFINLSPIADRGYVNVYALDVTERKQAEEQFAELEYFANTIISEINEGLAVYDCELKCKIWNKFMENLTGISAEDVIGKSTSETFQYLPQEQGIDYLLEQVLMGETVRSDDTLFYMPTTGGTVWLAGIYSPLRNTNGDIIGVIVIIRDITYRKRSELAIRESEGKYRALIESFPDVIIRFDQNARHIYVSNSVTKDTGMLPEQFIGKKHRDFGVPDDICRFWEQSVAKVFDTGKPYEKELEFGGINGPVIYNWRLVPEFSESGNVKTVLSIARDITEHRKSEKKYHDVFNSMINGLALHEIILDELGSPINYRYIDVNPAFERLTGLSRDSVVGKTVFDIFPKTKQYWINIYGMIALGGGPVNLEEYNEDIGRYFELTVYSPQNGQFVTIFEDITDRKQAEKLQESLQQASKLESIGRLAGGIAHDFNNLLTVMLGGALFGKKNLDESEPLYEILDMIEESAERAAELTQQLLAFSRKQIMEKKVINLNDLANNIRKMLTRLIGEDIELRTILPDDVGNINADPGQIEQVIVNLSVNARDAMPDGGKLTIETCNVELGGTYINKHVGVKMGKYVMLMVSDNGVGMDEDTKRQIFEPFFTTKKTGEGTGLGLATVYGIVKQHNGSIECYSELGHGTTFKIYLPQVEDDALKSAMGSDNSESLTGDETVLVVEDDDAVRDMIASFLRGLGYHVLSAENGNTALIVAEQQKMIHLILTDVVMPFMNGRQLAEKLRESHPEMKVLYTSGYTQNVIAHHGILDSGLSFIGKPYKPQTLAKKIRNILDS